MYIYTIYKYYLCSFFNPVYPRLLCTTMYLHYINIYHHHARKALLFLSLLFHLLKKNIINLIIVML